MKLSVAQEAEVKATFRKQSIRAVVFIGVFWLTMFAYQAGADEGTGTWFGLSVALWGPLIAAGALVGLIGFAVSMRCPSCKKTYGRPLVTRSLGAAASP